MVEWKINNAWTSSEGSSGVIFVEKFDSEAAENTSIFVLKGSSRVAEEIFSNRLGSLVELHVPNVRIVEYTNVEWIQIKEALLTFTNNNDDKEEDGKDDGNKEDNNTDTKNKVRQRLRSELDRAFFFVMDFVPGSPLECNYQLETYLSTSRSLFCQSLSSIIAFDILINNCDRIPLVHSNDGNASNILITSQGECIPIDTVLTSIHPTVSNRNLSIYIKRVETFLSIIFSFPLESTPETLLASSTGPKILSALFPLKDFIYRSTVYNLSEELLIVIAIEIQRSVRRIASLLSPDIIQRLKEEVSREVSTDWEGVWENSLKLINLEFLSMMVDVFRRYALL